MLRPYGLFTQKPLLVLLNVGDGAEATALATLSDYKHQQTATAAIHGRLEMELSQLSAEEAAEFLPEYGIQEPGMNRVIRLSYGLLGLQSFLTAGEDEVRAWTVHVGANAVEAAGVIHTDLARGFIRAEVISYDDMISAVTMAKARQLGLLRLEGKELHGPGRRHPEHSLQHLSSSAPGLCPARGPIFGRAQRPTPASDRKLHKLPRFPGPDSRRDRRHRRRPQPPSTPNRSNLASNSIDCKSLG